MAIGLVVVDTEDMLAEAKLAFPSLVRNSYFLDIDLLEGPK